MSPGRKKSVPPTIKCAVYCRVSTPDQMNGDFTSIDQQREAGEAYIASQRHEGWTCIIEQYDDVGFSGGTLDRPALTRLLNDITAGKVQVVVCYKLDRLTRSLLDFARLVEIFDKHDVSFVSVTQPINTADSTGRLMLNILLSFAQFERETIADRTRDKMSAARRKGKWTGGVPVLGYNVHPDGGKLVVNGDEARMVKAIFQLYLTHQTLLAVTKELNRRGWLTKSHTTKSGTTRGGKPWTKTQLHSLLTNPVYIGKVRHHGEIYSGEHKRIVSKKNWDRVQKILAENRHCGGSRVKNKYGFLLRGLLRCTACNAAMSPSVTHKRNRRYRYYICGNATQKGYKSCPHPSVNAAAIEKFVTQQIRVIGQDSALQEETLRQVRVVKKAKAPELKAEQKRLAREFEKTRDEIKRLIDALGSGEVNGFSISDRLGLLEDKSRRIESRLKEVADELAALKQTTVSNTDLNNALGLFDPIWDVLYPMEQERIIQLLIDRIDFDGDTNKMAIEFRPAGIKSLAGELCDIKMKESA